MQARQPLCVLIVDDEVHARVRIREILAQDPTISRIIEAEDGLAAASVIRRERPDLVLLDVQMPGQNGIGMIEDVGPELMPLTVFITAYDEHAVRAFELHAIDYVLKPYSDTRIVAALARAKNRLNDISLRSFTESLVDLLDARKIKKSYLDKLVIKEAGRTELIRVENIDCIESAGAFVSLHVGSRRIVHRAALADLCTRLDPRRFVRVHRSAIVNIESIVLLEPVSHGEFDAVLRLGQHVRVSRTYRPVLEERLDQSL